MKFEDHFEVMQTIARYGHALDSADAPFDTVRTEDGVFDMSSAGGVDPVPAGQVRL